MFLIGKIKLMDANRILRREPKINLHGIHCLGEAQDMIKICMYVNIIYIYMSASSKDFQRVLFDSKGWCIGTPYHPFSTLWNIQVYIVCVCVFFLGGSSQNDIPA